MDWFARQLLHWFDLNGRRDLPWQHPRTPYRVWVSEIMLQQTQVTTVLPYYDRFMARFPDVAALAAADQDEVLHYWTGLGYYARARNLHKAARMIAGELDGAFPDTAAALAELPGIGRSTASAIAAVCHGERAPILDGNVKRVLARFHAVGGHPSQAETARRLWFFADLHTPASRLADYTQAIMDLGALTCTRSRPDCGRCPLIARCEARALDRIADFPGRKARKEKPVRQARFFLIHTADGACLLEQRPATGLWGGLWTPPQRSAETAPETLCAEHGIRPTDIAETRVQPAFRHTFTHFHLDIEPVHLRLHRAPSLAADRPDVRWHAPGTNQPIGLAAPAVKLLASLQPFELS